MAVDPGVPVAYPVGRVGGVYELDTVGPPSVVGPVGWAVDDPP